MSAALDGAQRTALGNLIQKARSLLEDDLASTLEGDFGIHRNDGRLEEADALSLNALRTAVRIDLLDIVAFLRNEGETASASVERLIREAAFTHVNRLVALRVAEGLGILPGAIGKGLASQGFRDFAEIAPASADEDWERFRLFVRICADELSADVPALFDPRNPLLELAVRCGGRDDLVGARRARLVVPVLQLGRRAQGDAGVLGSSQLARARRPEPVLHAVIRGRLSCPEWTRSTPLSIVPIVGR
jgi:hypothetical protein